MRYTSFARFVMHVFSDFRKGNPPIRWNGAPIAQLQNRQHRFLLESKGMRMLSSASAGLDTPPFVFYDDILGLKLAAHRFLFTLDSSYLLAATYRVQGFVLVVRIFHWFLDPTNLLKSSFTWSTSISHDLLDDFEPYDQRAYLVGGKTKSNLYKFITKGGYIKRKYMNNICFMKKDD